MRVGDDIARRVVAGVADPGRVGALLDPGQIMPGAPVCDRLVETSRWATRSAFDAYRGSSARSSRPMICGQPLPFAIVRRAEHHGLAVGGGVRTVQRHRGRAHSPRFLVDAGVRGGS